MNSNPGDDLSTVKNEKEEFSETKSPRHSDGILLQPGIPPLQALDEDDAHSSANASNNQIVLYEPEAANQDVVVSELMDYDASLPKFATSTFSNRVLPSVGAFTVQCAICFKWRLIPTKEKYEEIRANIMEEPFVCATARTWREGVSCDIPADINQDGSRLWAIDKPSIAQPPPGWQRLLRIRGEGSTRFADVYYVTPTGKRLRSMVEIDKYLHDHPEYVEAGVKISQFSFQIPKPLQENYVRKRPHRTMQQFDGANLLPMPRANEPVEANPLAWAGPLSDTNGQVQIGDPTASDLYESPISLAPSRKKQATRSPHKMYNNSVHSYEH